MKARWFLFALVVLVQLAVPAGMIARRELTLREGEAFKFRTAPVDPYDAFRGRYVALSLEASRITLLPDHDFRSGEKVFASIVTDENGYAMFDYISRVRPVTGAYLAVRLADVYDGNGTLQLPFDRYYMNEDEAPEAEMAYRSATTMDGSRAAHLLIRIRRGYGVIEDLYIDNLPVREFLGRGPGI